ncbi:MAG: flagellar hook-associated protein FlgK [Geminicoccaceae bacterium]
MAISAAFNIAQSGLNANKQRADIAANNIANALTPGYHRKDVTLSAWVGAGRSGGVTTGALLRAHDTAMQQSLRDSAAGAGLDGARAAAATRLIDSLGEPGSGDSIAETFNALEDAFVDLYNDPGDIYRQGEVLRAAQGVAAKLNRLHDVVVQSRLEADQAIGRGVDALKADLTEIQTLNREIVRSVGSGVDHVDLLDARDAAVDRVAEKVGAIVHEKSDGSIALFTAGGVPLLDVNISTIGFGATASLDAGSRYDPLGGGSLSGLVIAGIDVTPAAGGPQQLTSGSLAGHFAVRDDDALQSIAVLDTLAANTIARFQDPTVDTSLTLGDPGLFTDAGAYLADTSVNIPVGLSGAIRVNPIVDPAQGGATFRLRDGLAAVTAGPESHQQQVDRFLDAIGRLEPLPAQSGLTTNRSLNGFASDINIQLAATNVGIENTASRSDEALTVLQTSYSNLTGVNTDLELQNVLEAEKLFAANANVLQTASSMIDELLRLI